MALAATAEIGGMGGAVALQRADARGAFVLTCDHASRHIPAEFSGLDLPDSELQRHIAWDIGALGLSEALAERLDAVLLHPTVSRLLLDVNRDPDAHDSIPHASEDTRIPGNHDLSDEARRQRRDWIYAPYHDAIEALIGQRIAQRTPTAVIAIHSFTPVFKGATRPWQVGVLSHHDRRMSDSMLRELRGDPALVIGDNEPYAPRNGVYHTLDRHAEAHGLPCVMIEVRNDLIADAAGQRTWADRLAPLFVRALEDATSIRGIAAHR